MYGPYAIVLHDERVAWRRRRLEEDCIRCVDGDVVVKVVERGEEEAIRRIQIWMRPEGDKRLETYLDVAVFVRVLGASSDCVCEIVQSENIRQITHHNDGISRDGASQC